MKRLLLALLLFASPVLSEKYTIYTTERPPSSWSGIIDSEGYFIDLLMLFHLLKNISAILFLKVVG